MSSSPAASQPGGSGGRPAGAPAVTVVAGRYRLLSRLGEGGMGVVYKAEHTLSKKKLAIKILHPHLCHGRQAVERFKREVSAAAEIDHPGVVQVFDAGVDTDGSFYMAMELLEGESLAQRTRREWPGTRTTVALVREMCEPLARAHAKGFVHRDLKPDNVFIARDVETGRERPKILDFGLVREVTRRGPTMSGITFGTPEYMSPEQAMSAKKAGIPSDVWSVGVILYELLAGRHPFTGETPNAVMANAIKEPLPPLASVAQHVPEDLAAIVERCLEKDPARRPQDCAELGELLRDLMQTVELDEQKPSSIERRRYEDEDEQEASAEVEALRASSEPVPLEAHAPEPTPHLSRPSGRAAAPLWPWALGGVAVLGAIAAAVVVLGGGGDPPVVATELPRDPAAEQPPSPAAPVEAAGVAPGAPVASPGSAPAAGGVAPAAGGVAPAAGGVAPAAGGVAPAAGGVAPAAGGVAPAAGGVAPVAAERTSPRAVGTTPARSEERPAARTERTPREEAPPSAEETESAVETARACLARGDTRCAVAALQDARGASAMALLVDVYRMQGRSTEARSVMQRYVQRYPRGAQTAEYERELGLAGH